MTRSFLVVPSATEVRDPCVVRSYLDHAATTPLRSEVIAAMRPWTDGAWPTNPNGVHADSRRARHALEEARDRIALSFGADPHEVIFTSGGTEALNAAVYGALANAVPGVVIRSPIEHDAVRASTDRWAATFGHRVVELHVGRNGVTTMPLAEELELSPDEVRLVAIMAVNNEIGTTQPAARSWLGARPLRLSSAATLCDGVCAASWIRPAELATMGDLVAVSGHKIGGPSGIGVLLAKGARLSPLIVGGGQEQDRRSGTQNVAAAVGLAAAVELLGTEEARAWQGRIQDLRDRLADGLLTTIAGVSETGDRTQKTPGHVHLLIAGVSSEELLLLLDRAGVSASAGSACSSGALHASHVLLAMGISKEQALGSLRLTLGWNTTETEIEHALEVVPAAVAQLRR